MLFDRWNLITIEELRSSFGLYDLTSYEKAAVAVRYGCERVNLESRGLIMELLGDKPWPRRP